MSDEKKNRRGLDGDDFWDLGEPTVRKAVSKSSAKRQTREPVAAEIKVASAPDDTSFADIPFGDSAKPREKDADRAQGTVMTQYIPPHKPKKAEKAPIIEYTPSNILLKRVRIFSSAKDGKIFDRSNLFIRERNAFLNREGKLCPKADFFSFSPRYSQMTRAQLDWYLWWRENMRRGEYIDTDEAYIRLYLQELLATDEGEDIIGSLDKMCELFNLSAKNKGFIYPISHMIFDFCLLHKLDAPVEKLLDNYSRIVFFEEGNDFFLGMSRENRKFFPDIVLKYISVYNYKKSKFATSENSAFFDTHMRGAISAVLCDDKAFDAIAACASGIFNSTLTEHRLFRSSSNLSTPALRAEISAYPLSCIKGVLTDAVRYTENCLREHLGIKSKLTVLSVQPDVKAVIDRYFAEHLPRTAASAKVKKASPKVNEYDKLYDLPEVEISSASAAQIEEDSWNTTRLLTEAFGDTANESSVEAPIPFDEPLKLPEPASEESNTDELGDGLYASIRKELGEQADLINLCLNGNAAEQRSFAKEFGMTVDEIVDAVNGSSAVLMGDILLEDVGGVYRIIDDYKDKI